MNSTGELVGLVLVDVGALELGELVDAEAAAIQAAAAAMLLGELRKAGQL